MTKAGVLRVGVLGCWIACATIVACAHLPLTALPGPGSSPSPGTTPSPSPSGSPTSSPTPAACGTQAPNATDFVAMTATAHATVDSTYGIINGYTDQYVNGQPSAVANVVQVSSSAVVQFVNLEPLAPPPSPGATPTIIFHSAVGLPTAFPSPAFTFPAQAFNQVGSQISSALWSTGLVGQDPTNVNICFSQALTVPTGPAVYPFGDIEYFGSSNMRDVIVVSGSATVNRRPAFLRRATRLP